MCSLQPSRLPALVIRQVTTVRVLDVGQQRRSRWQPETLAPNSVLLTRPKAPFTPHPLKNNNNKKKKFMARKEEWAMIVDWTFQNKYVLVDSAMTKNENVQLVAQFME